MCRFATKCIESLRMTQWGAGAPEPRVAGMLGIAPDPHHPHNINSKRQHAVTFSRHTLGSAALLLSKCHIVRLHCSRVTLTCYALTTSCVLTSTLSDVDDGGNSDAVSLRAFGKIGLAGFVQQIACCIRNLGSRRVSLLAISIKSAPTADSQT